MSQSPDPRLAVRLVPHAAGLPADALVLPRASRPTHAASCACCAPRSAFAQALSAIWLARARACTPLTAELLVAADPTDVPALRAAITDDMLLRARVRLADV